MNRVRVVFDDAIFQDFWQDFHSMKKVAIVGFGFMGGMHAQVYKQLSNARVVAVADSMSKVVHKKMKSLGLKVPLYPNLKALLAHEASGLDVVDICLPTDEHAENALLAIRAGKHVFCEKPLALTSADGQRVVDAARKAGVKLMVGHCLRFWPEYQAFEAFVKSRRAGRLLSLTMQRRSARPTHGVQNWLQNSARSMGCALDMHIHDTDYVHHLLGNPKAVASYGNKDSAGWSQIFTTYLFKNTVVRAEGGWNYPSQWGFQMAFQAVFERGAVEYDSRATPSLKVTLEGKTTRPLPFKTPRAGSSSLRDGNVSSLGGYYSELKYFIQCLEKGQHPKIATGEQAVRSVKTVLAEIQSLERGGRPVLIS